MLLPTKGISTDRALLTVGSEVMRELRGPMSVSALWEKYADTRRAQESAEKITFDWFSLALTTMYAMGLLEWTPEGYLRSADVR